MDLGKVYFNVGRSRSSREETISAIISQIDSLIASGKLKEVNIEGSASPEGHIELNRKLARNRAIFTAERIKRSTGIDPSLINITSRVFSWRDACEEGVARGIVDSYSCGKGDGGVIDRATRRKLNESVFPEMRAARVTVVTRDLEKIEYVVYEDEIIGEAPVEEPSAVAGGEKTSREEVMPEPVVDMDQGVEERLDRETGEWVRNMRVKSNLPAWGMLWMNVHAEVDLVPHFSFSLPVYYSFYNYFSRRRKFRTFGVQPELRWFARRDNKGFFIGAHFGVFYYNVAFGGETRYQDHDGKTPAIGGGLAVGYRWKLGKGADTRWEMEASLGGGIYRLDYDLFRNETNGLLTGRRKRTFYGIDQASLSLIYRFGVTRHAEKKGDGL